MRAQELVEIRAKGRVLGDIFTPRIAVIEGGEFNGKIQMKNDESKVIELEFKGREMAKIWSYPRMSFGRTRMIIGGPGDISSISHSSRFLFGKTPSSASHIGICPHLFLVLRPDFLFPAETPSNGNNRIIVPVDYHSLVEAITEEDTTGPLFEEGSISAMNVLLRHLKKARI